MRQRPPPASEALPQPSSPAGKLQPGQAPRPSTTLGSLVLGLRRVAEREARAQLSRCRSQLEVSRALATQASDALAQAAQKQQQHRLAQQRPATSPTSTRRAFELAAYAAELQRQQASVAKLQAEADAAATRLDTLRREHELLQEQLRLAIARREAAVLFETSAQREQRRHRALRQRIQEEEARDRFMVTQLQQNKKPSSR